MAHDDRIGHGTQMVRSVDGLLASTYLSVGRIRDLTPPALARDTVETTDMESPNRWEEFIGGIKRSGEVSFEITFDPGSTETTEFMTDLNNDNPRYYGLNFPDGTNWRFLAILTGFDPGVPVADKMTATVTYKLTGQPGWIS